MTTILTDSFETKLGTITTWLQTDSDDFIQQPERFSCVTGRHTVYCQIFDLKQIWKPETMEYETSRGWRWFIQKTDDQKEQLTLFCKLINPSEGTEWNINSGECLDAIEIENKTHHLHIGTEDGEIMHHRAKDSDWMPGRFKDEAGLNKSFTKYIDFGFKTTIPDLKEGEKIYFHFITATNTIKPGKEHKDERDVSTWFAVDQPKRYLDEKLKNTIGNSDLAYVGFDKETVKQTVSRVN